MRKRALIKDLALTVELGRGVTGALPRVAGLLLVLGACMPSPSQAEALFYDYDARGRLAHVCQQRPSDTFRRDYNLDAADNRASHVSTKTDIAIPAGSSLTSDDGRFSLRMQTDGNLVLVINSSNTPLWWTGTNGTGAYAAYMQGDGNLVVYAPGRAVWSSGTFNYPCGRLAVQNDGNLVVYSAISAPVWSTGTYGH